MRIIKSRQLHVLLRQYFDDRKRRIRDFTHVAFRKRANDRVHALLHAHAAGRHGGEDFAGQRRENIRLHAAAEPVRKHADRRVVRGREFRAVAAELLSRLDQADMSPIDIQIIHRPESLPSALPA